MKKNYWGSSAAASASAATSAFVERSASFGILLILKDDLVLRLLVDVGVGGFLWIALALRIGEGCNVLLGVEGDITDAKGGVSNAEGDVSDDEGGVMDDEGGVTDDEGGVCDAKGSELGDGMDVESDEIQGIFWDFWVNEDCPRKKLKACNSK